MKNNAFFYIIDFLVPFGLLLRRDKLDYSFNYWFSVLYRFVPHTWFIFWLTFLIPYVGNLFYGLVLIPISAAKHIQIKNINKLSDKASIYLWYYVVILIGFGGLWSFVGHTFLAESVASSIGWQTSPFQTELAFYTLGSAVVGILAIWLRGHIITAIVISKSIFWLGAAYTHIHDALINHNYSLMNIGAVLVGDLLYPVILLSLLIIVIKDDVRNAFIKF